VIRREVHGDPERIAGKPVVLEHEAGDLPWLETITRKRWLSAAPGAIAGMVSEIGYLGDRRLWTRENAADASIDVPRIRAIVSTMKEALKRAAVEDDRSLSGMAVRMLRAQLTALGYMGKE
jgi:hypothetical protein